MRIIRQNGCRHPLNRSELEIIVQQLPIQLAKTASSITLYSAEEGAHPYCTYHMQNSLIGFYGNSKNPTKAEKEEALIELYVGLSTICDLGHIPDKLSNSKRSSYINDWQVEIEKSKNVLFENAS